MIVLRSSEILVRVDPAQGGEILDLVDLRTGRQLLGRPPFGSDEPLGGDLDEETWTARYRGGWQLVAPNAGNPCRVGDELHGFHGRASNDPWVSSVSDAGDAASLTWVGHGLRITRALEVSGDTLAVTTTASALERRAPLVAVEHVAMGLELLEPEVTIELPGGVAYELSEQTGPASPPPEAPAWPEALLLDGATERCDSWALARPRSRLLAVADLPEGRATVRNATRGQGLELAWDNEWLRHLWIWHEVRSYGGIWRGQAEILVVEPASVPHSLGLAAAIEHGQARWLQPGETASYRITARPIRS